MTWQFSAAMNACIAVGYFAICGTIVRGLIRTNQLRTNPLASATAAIFFTCAVHHGAHTVHMLLPVFGGDRVHGLAMRQAFGWQSAVWDFVGAVVAIYYLSLRRTYGTLLRTPAMFEDEVRRRTTDLIERERLMLTQAEELAGSGSWAYDFGGGALRWSSGMYRIRGREQDGEEMTLDTARADLHPDDRERFGADFSFANPGDGVLRSAYRIIRPDGATRHLESVGRVERDSEGVPARMIGATVDVTERRMTEIARDQAEGELRQREKMLSEAEERFRGAFENAPIGMALIAPDGRFLQVNAVLCEITGYGQHEFDALDLERLTHHEDARAVVDALAGMREDGAERASLEQRFMRPDRSVVWVQLQLTLLRDQDDRPVRFIAQVQDISSRRSYEDQLRHMADHDPLTGLLNRRSFEQMVERQLPVARRYGTDGALVFIDLDDFKYVNDSLGHSAGDKLIIEVAAALTGELRESDVIARLGGDEFAVFLPQTDAGAAQLVADKLLTRIASIQVSMGGANTSKLTASCGIAMLDDAFATADEILVAADLAMYDAKEAGKNRSRPYSTDEHYEPRIKARMAWIDHIKSAMADDGAGLVLHAQPIVDIAQGEVAQYELLVRMLGTDGEIVMPGTFLYIAERFDLIQQLDRIVIARAVRYLAEQTQSQVPRVAVNVSARSLSDPALPDYIEGVLHDASIDPGRICFEITETAAISNIPLARHFGERLGDIGCELALDDFGAGYGSFYYLKHLRFDYVKIDGEFITDCVTSRTDQLVIDSIVNLTRGLGKRTIAEFVQDESTLVYLREHGVDFAQGFHVGKPAALLQRSSALT